MSFAADCMIKAALGPKEIVKRWAKAPARSFYKTMNAPERLLRLAEKAKGRGKRWADQGRKWGAKGTNLAARKQLMSTPLQVLGTGMMLQRAYNMVTPKEQ